MKAFHALLTSLYRIQPPLGAGPLPPREVLGAWNERSDLNGSSDLTVWGAFLADQNLVNCENPVIWSSVNTSHFDKTKQIFRNDQDVRNWFPVQFADRGHVNKVHGVVSTPDARATYLSASYIAEGLDRAKETEYLGIPWLLAKDATHFSSAEAVTIALGNGGKRVVIKHPRKNLIDLHELLITENKISTVSRFTNYIQQIMLPNISAGQKRTACCLLRVPAGQIATDYHLIEFFHAFTKLPSDKLITEIVGATEIAAAAVQSVIAPTILPEVANARIGTFFNSVVSHDIDNWRINVADSVDSLRHTLNTINKSRLPEAARNAIEEDLDCIAFDNEIFHAVVQGFSWRPSGTCKTRVKSVALNRTIERIRKLRHPDLLKKALTVSVTGEATEIQVPGEINVVLANLIRNAVKANQHSPPAEINVKIVASSSSVRISVASVKPFVLSEWVESHHDEEWPKEHKGLWLCRQMLKSFGSELEQELDERFGCVLYFFLPVL